MKKLLLLSAFVILSCQDKEIDSTFDFDQKNYSEAFQLIEFWLEAQKDYDNLPGLTAMIADQDGMVWSDAFGMQNGNEEMNIENTFSICSISKLFTSIAIMRLVEE